MIQLAQHLRGPSKKNGQNECACMAPAQQSLKQGRGQEGRGVQEIFSHFLLFFIFENIMEKSHSHQFGHS